MDNLECSREATVVVHQSNERNTNQIDNAWKNIFDTLDRKMLESDGVDATAAREQVQENNNGNNPAIASSHPAIEFVPSHNYRLIEDSVGVDHTENRAITMESIMEKENDLFKELSTVEYSALSYFKNYWTNDKKPEPAAAPSAALSKPTEFVSETIENDEDSIGADFAATADSTIIGCPSVELIMERKDNLFKKLTEIEHNMLNYFKNFRTKVTVHSEPAAAMTAAVALTKKTESDSEIDVDNGSYVDVHPGRAQTVVEATLESTEKIAPAALGGDYEGGDCCSRNRGDNWTGNNDEFATLSPLVTNGHRNQDDNGDEKYCNEGLYDTESSADDSLEQFEMSNEAKYLEIDLHNYPSSSTIDNPNKRDHHQKSEFYCYFADDDQYESMDEEPQCSQNLWRPLDNSREQYETRKTKNRMRYQQNVNRCNDYVDDNHCCNVNLNEDYDHYSYYSFDEGGQQMIDKKPKKIKKCIDKCRRLTENINQ